MKTYKSLFLLFALSILPFGAIAAVPFGGATVPIGSSAGSWSPGYAIGLETPVSQRHGLDWSALFSIVRVTPNGENLLRTAGRTLKVETTRGWSLSVEASLIASKCIAASASNEWQFRLFGGAGLFYLQDADVFVGGFQPTGPSAVNRQRFIDGQTLVAPGVTLGFAGLIYGNVEPTVRLQHILTGESTRDYLLLGLNFKPR